MQHCNTVAILGSLVLLTWCLQPAVAQDDAKKLEFEPRIFSVLDEDQRQTVAEQSVADPNAMDLGQLHQMATAYYKLSREPIGKPVKDQLLIRTLMYGKLYLQKQKDTGAPERLQVILITDMASGYLQKKQIDPDQQVEALLGILSPPKPKPEPVKPKPEPVKPKPKPEPKDEGPNPKLFVNKIGMKMRRIQPGQFMMGSAANEQGRHPDETQFEVKLPNMFYISETEVTQQQYQQVVGKNPSLYRQADKPVENVSYNDAVQFCEKLSAMTGRTYRLPTEAEWEYACRAGAQTPFNIGRAKLSIRFANIDGAAQGEKTPAGPEPVGSYPSNRWGLRDMHGNVWEWVATGYGRYPDGSQVNPQGPEKPDRYVLRGGSWRRGPERARSASRAQAPPQTREDHIGFRVVCAPAKTGRH